MPNTLGLDDDLDGVELVQGVEAAFGVRVTDAEANALYTVGDVYGLLRGRLSSPDAKGHCATAMTFYRLRRAFVDLGTDPEMIRPDVGVKSLAPLAAKELFKQIGATSTLRLPRPRITWVGVTGGWSIFAGVVSLFAFAILDVSWWLVAILIIAFGIILVRIDPRKVPPDCQTVGELSRRVAGLNFGKLFAEGAKPRDSDLWSALVEVLSEHSFLPKSEIRPETLLLQSQLKSA